MTIISAQVRWEHTKDVINTVLGLGYGPYHDHVIQFYKLIDEDFGIPTDSDITDFILSAQDLPTDCTKEKQSIAKEITIAALRLY